MSWRNPVTLDKAISDLKLLLSTYSPSGSEEEAAKVFVEIAESLGLKGYIDDYGNAWACFESYKARNSFSTLLVGHLDTVPGYIEVKVKGSIIEGRGAVGAKGPLLSHLYALAGLKGLGDTGLRICVVGLIGEEADSPGAKSLVARQIKAEHVIIAEPTGLDTVVLGYRGSMPLRVVCRAEGGHSSTPLAWRSAYEKFHEAWSILRSKYMSISYKNPTMAVTIIHAGAYHNMLPDTLEAYIDVRIPFDYDYDNLLSEIKKTFSNRDCEVQVLGITKPVKVKPQNPAPRALIRSLIRHGYKPRIAYKLGTSDMNLLYNTITKDIVAYGPGDPSLSHTMREAIDVNELLAASKVLGAAIIELQKESLNFKVVR